MSVIVKEEKTYVFRNKPPARAVHRHCLFPQVEKLYMHRRDVKDPAAFEPTRRRTPNGI